MQQHQCLVNGCETQPQLVLVFSRLTIPGSDIIYGGFLSGIYGLLPHAAYVIFHIFRRKDNDFWLKKKSFRGYSNYQTTSFIVDFALNMSSGYSIADISTLSDCRFHSQRTRMLGFCKNWKNASD
mgnify:CR=1 FL=1